MPPTGTPTYSTIEEAVEIAQNLAPKLRERVARAEELRRLPEANVPIYSTAASSTSKRRGAGAARSSTSMR